MKEFTVTCRGSKYIRHGIDQAIGFISSQAQVRQVLEQIQQELQAARGEYRWELEVHPRRKEYAIVALWKKDKWYDTQWHKTPRKALIELCQKVGLLSDSFG